MEIKCIYKIEDLFIKPTHWLTVNILSMSLPCVPGTGDCPVGAHCEGRDSDRRRLQEQARGHQRAFRPPPRERMWLRQWSAQVSWFVKYARDEPCIIYFLRNNCSVSCSSLKKVNRPFCLAESAQTASISSLTASAWRTATEATRSSSPWENTFSMVRCS